jgi:II/X family phage/plasmid replication protein
MIDIFKITIPFHHDFCSGSAADNFGLVDLQQCQLSGAKLAAGEIEYDVDGMVTVSRLMHPYESISSSNGSLAFKIFSGGENYWPFVELKASPAKLLQGHNVYGSCDVPKCAMSLIETFVEGMPELVHMLDMHLAEVKQIDVTFSAQMENETQARQAISALKNVSSGQTRSSKNSHATTCYFGINSNGKKSSRYKQLKIYLKGAELQHQIDELNKKFKKTNLPMYQKQLDIMTALDVVGYAKNALRFEASILTRMFNRLKIPTHLGDFMDYAENYEGCIIQKLWIEAFKDVFIALGDEKMNLFDDEEIEEQLKNDFASVSDLTGKISYSRPNRLFRFYRSFKNEGFDEVKRTTPKATFYRNMTDLCTVVSKAHLQNLKGVAATVVPILKVINVDFSRQHPLSYIEPLSIFEQMQFSKVS